MWVAPRQTANPCLGGLGVRTLLSSGTLGDGGQGLRATRSPGGSRPGREACLQQGTAAVGTGALRRSAPNSKALEARPLTRVWLNPRGSRAAVAQKAVTRQVAVSRREAARVPWLPTPSPASLVTSTSCSEPLASLGPYGDTIQAASGPFPNLASRVSSP